MTVQSPPVIGAVAATPFHLDTQPGRVAEDVRAALPDPWSDVFAPAEYRRSVSGVAARPDPPDEEEIRVALRGNLCRCTGYDTIVDACKAACGDDR